MKRIFGLLTVMSVAIPALVGASHATSGTSAEHTTPTASKSGEMVRGPSN